MLYAILFASGVLLIAAALGLVHYALLGNPTRRPTDAFQWSAVGLSSIVLIFATLMIVLVVVGKERGVLSPIPLETAEVRPDEIDRPVSDFSFRLVSSDEDVRFSELRGRVVLVNIWATWCAPCRFELPELNRLQSDYRAAGLVVLNLSDEPRADLLTYQEELPLSTMSAYVDPLDVPEPLRRNFSIRPTSFVIDRDGILRATALGMRSYDQFESMVEPYLEKSAREV